jgi:hypothetical protein
MSRKRKASQDLDSNIPSYSYKVPSYKSLHTHMEAWTELPKVLIELTLEYEGTRFFLSDCPFETWLEKYHQIRRLPKHTSFEEHLPRPYELIPFCFGTGRTGRIMQLDEFVTLVEGMWERLLDSNYPILEDEVKSDVRSIPRRDREKILYSHWAPFLSEWKWMTCEDLAWKVSLKNMQEEVDLPLVVHSSYLEEPLRSRSMAFLALYFSRCRGIRSAEQAAASLNLFFARLFGASGTAFMLWVSMVGCHQRNSSSMTFEWDFNEGTNKYRQHSTFQVLYDLKQKVKRQPLGHDWEGELQKVLQKMKRREGKQKRKVKKKETTSQP